MKRTYLYAAGIVVALIPAVLGLTGNASFSQSVPVRVPDQQPARVATSTPSSTPTHDAASGHDGSGDDDNNHHGGGSDDDGSHGHGSGD
jgi:hypothetical protein